MRNLNTPCNEDGRVVKATGLRSVGAICVGSNPTPRRLSYMTQYFFYCVFLRYNKNKYAVIKRYSLKYKASLHSL